MTTVGRHTLNPFPSPVRASSIDANVVRGNDNQLQGKLNAHDEDPTIHVQSSTLANRPAAGEAGRTWVTDDGTTVTHWYDDGTNWIELASDAPYVAVVDAITAPATVSGKALIYVDSADGDLKVKFGDGTVKTLATNP